MAENNLLGETAAHRNCKVRLELGTRHRHLVTFRQTHHHAVVTRWGMSDKLGPLAYAENEEEVFLGHSVARQQNMSEETQRVIDAEVRRIVDEGYETARKVLTDHIDDLHTIAKGLLEYETLSGEEIQNLLKGEPPVRDRGDTQRPVEGPTSSVPVTGATPGGDGPMGVPPAPQGT